MDERARNVNKILAASGSVDDQFGIERVSAEQDDDPFLDGGEDFGVDLNFCAAGARAFFIPSWLGVVQKFHNRIGDLSHFWFLHAKRRHSGCPNAHAGSVPGAVLVKRNTIAVDREARLS